MEDSDISSVGCQIIDKNSPDDHYTNLLTCIYNNIRNLQNCDNALKTLNDNIKKNNTEKKKTEKSYGKTNPTQELQQSISLITSVYNDKLKLIKIAKNIKEIKNQIESNIIIFIEKLEEKTKPNSDNEINTNNKKLILELKTVNDSNINKYKKHNNYYTNIKEKLLSLENKLTSKIQQNNTKKG